MITIPFNGMALKKSENKTLEETWQPFILYFVFI